MTFRSPGLERVVRESPQRLQGWGRPFSQNNFSASAFRQWAAHGIPDWVGRQRKSADTRAHELDLIVDVQGLERVIADTPKRNKQRGRARVAPIKQALWARWVREMKKERVEKEAKKPCCPLCSKPVG